LNILAVLFSHISNMHVVILL